MNRTVKKVLRRPFKVILNLLSKIDLREGELDDVEIISRNLLIDHRKLTYGDQKGQVDFFINHVMNYEKSGLNKTGYFVDLACADGVTFNNTLFLERWLGWNGILFEPNPHYLNAIKERRNSPLVTKCVSEKSGEVLRFRIDNGMFGGIISNDTDNNALIRGDELKNAEIIEVETTTLEKELDEHDAPTTIDFLSLDIEGAEFLALKNFNFKKYKFRFAAIERPTPELDLLMHDNGYRQVQHSLFDVFYVHEDYLSEINWAPNTYFAFTPRKNW